jgi:hypothetical protein
MSALNSPGPERHGLWKNAKSHFSHWRAVSLRDLLLAHSGCSKGYAIEREIFIVCMVIGLGHSAHHDPQGPREGF